MQTSHICSHCGTEEGGRDRMGGEVRGKKNM